MVSNRIIHLSDGEQALDYLHRRGAYESPEDSPWPHLILLDLRLPKVDGIEVLKNIKSTPGLKQIPVVVLTSSAAETDLTRAYDNHANSYLVKPVDFTKFAEMLREMRFYWLIWNQHPRLQDSS